MKDKKKILSTLKPGIFFAELAHSPAERSRLHECPWSRRTCDAAAAAGCLDALQWLRARGCPWDAGRDYWARPNSFLVGARVCGKILDSRNEGLGEGRGGVTKKQKRGERKKWN